ncbi:hypothetical protein UT300005_34350 [Clostridium sp. CTA-5]
MKKAYLRNLIITTVVFSTIVAIPPVTANAIWNKDSQNNWIWIEDEVKSIGWKKINDKWYYFNKEGIMRIGWFKDTNNKWYYLSENGEMKTGWLKDNDGRWYYLSNDGTMRIGWFKDTNENWYYLSSNGVMKTGWLKDNDGNWYHLSENGSMNIGWLNENGVYYYLGFNGCMVTGNISIDGIIYNFSDNGALIEEKNDNIEEKNDNNESENCTGYVATESSPLNIREDALISAKIVGKLSKGTKITVIGKEVNGFYKVSGNGIEGWASSEWISFTPPNEIIPPTENPDENSNISEFKIRTIAPELDDRDYYSDDNIFYKARLSPPFFNNGNVIVGNCTWYAWGRIWEITGKPPIDASFTGNGYEWWEANKNSGKYKYGTTPRIGALAVWQSSLPKSGGFGHVAVVEKIENSRVYISESAWHGVLFKYREIYNTEYLYGYIYIDEPNY